MKKKLAYLLFLSMLCGVLNGCAMRTPEQRPDDKDNYNTGDASMDNPRNQDRIGERELLVVSFGTSFNDSRRLTIGTIENTLEAAFPDWSVRRGFTSQIIIDHIKSRDDVSIDNVPDALRRAVSNGVKTLVVQPTHLMSGFEYQELADEISNYADGFEAVAIGEPLLTSDDDFFRVADAVIKATAQYDDGETAICFMGHGTEADSNGVYAKMQSVLTEKGADNYYIGTVEAAPTLEDVLAMVRARDYLKVVLQPLMIVAGDHANNDMAGDDEDSWKSVFENAGYEVTCVLRGLGELEEIQTLFAEHAQAAMKSVTRETDTSRVADESGMAESADISLDGLRPVYASDLKSGTYAIKVDSSSSMFRVTDCALSVADGQMNAVMTMSGTGYLYVYPGTASDAAAASDADYIPFAENADGAHTFTIPVAALDTGVLCAAFSKNRETWYDRTLCFRADSLPLEAFADGFLTTAQSLGLSDGNYTVSVTLNGGSGRASVTSPAALTVRDGVCTVLIEWSSPNYDYMRVNGEQYFPVSAEGNSVFEIPVSAFDCPLTAFADTVAMSQPHEIEYSLTFDSATVQAA